MPWQVYNSAGQLLQATDLVDGTVTASKLDTNAVTNAKVADDAIGVAELSATGTASSSVFLRGDNAWAAPGGGPSQATQSAIEAETNEDTYVPPDLMKHHPGVAKVWLNWEQTGANSVLGSYNVTSVSDGGAAGLSDILWATDFSNATYALAGIGEGAYYTPRALYYEVDSKIAGGVTILVLAGLVLNDSTDLTVVGFGDQ